MADRYRDRDRNRQQRYYNQEGDYSSNRDWNRDQDWEWDQERNRWRDRNRERDWNRDWDQNRGREQNRQRDWNDMGDQSYNRWRFENSEDYMNEAGYRGGYSGQRQDTHSLGRRYGQNYTRGWSGEDWDDRDYDQRFRGQSRVYDQDYGQNFDQDFGRDRQVYSRDYARSYNRGDYDWEYDRPYRRREAWEEDRGFQGRGRQYGTGGMQSDFEPEQRYRSNINRGSDREYYQGYGRDYGRDLDRRRFMQDPDRDYVGYEEEGAFYQDLDEPYSYDYWSIDVIEYGDFTGVGPQGFSRSDDRIMEEVGEALMRHGYIDASDIEMDVKDGIVTLRGSVPDRRMKHLAEDTIENIFGVKEVHNELRARKQHEQYQRGYRDRGYQEGWIGEGQHADEAGWPTTISDPNTTGIGSTTGLEESGSTPATTGRREQRAASSTSQTSRTSSQKMERGGQTTQQIREGMEVIGKNGKIVGRVKQIRNNDFLVDRELARDVFVPFKHVKSVGQQAMLDIESEEVDNQNWETPGLIGS